MNWVNGADRPAAAADDDDDDDADAENNDEDVPVCVWDVGRNWGTAAAVEDAKRPAAADEVEPTDRDIKVEEPDTCSRPPRDSAVSLKYTLHTYRL